MKAELKGRGRWAWVVVGALTLVLGACQPGGGTAPEDEAARAATPGSFEHARGFAIRAMDGYRLVEVTEPWPGATDTLRYVLLPHDSVAPDVRGATVIRTPIRRIVALSTTHLAMLDRLGLANRVVGVSGAPWVNTPSIRARIEAGEVVEVGQPEGLNYEQIVALEPDLVMASGGSPLETRDRLAPFGIPVVVNAEYAEETPLGQAEWIRFIAAFFGADAAADDLFEAVAERYTDLARRARRQRDRPSVFLNANWRGTWFMAGGESFSAQLLDDAGADYLWAHTETDGSLALDFEAVYFRAADADVWLNPGAATSLEALLEQDDRYDGFQAWETGEVYNNNRRVNPAGGNAYWEAGIMEPDVILADLVKIFHPRLVRDHTFVYYQRLPRDDPDPL